MDQPYEDHIGLESAMPQRKRLSVADIIDTIDAGRGAIQAALETEIDPVERLSLRSKELALAELLLHIMTRLEEDRRWQ